MADEGWIKFYRKTKKSFVWANPYQLKLWLLLLTKATHSTQKFIFNGSEMFLNSGQLVTGRVVLTDEMNEGMKKSQHCNSSSVWKWIKKFESEQMLNITSTSKYSVITITNWGQYQENEHQSNIKVTSSEHQSNTYKNDKNDKNEKNKDYQKSDSPDLNEQFTYIWMKYPKKIGRAKAFEAYKQARLEGTTDDDIEKGIENYKKYLELNDIQEGYTKNGSTFFESRSWEDEPDLTPPKVSGDTNGSFTAEDMGF